MNYHNTKYFYLSIRNTIIDIDWHGKDSFWCFFGNFFNVHTTIWGTNKNRAIECSVHQYSQVSFTFNIKCLINTIQILLLMNFTYMSDHDFLYFDTFWWSLFCCESVSNHSLDKFASFRWFFGQMDTTLTYLKY